MRDEATRRRKLRMLVYHAAMHNEDPGITLHSLGLKRVLGKDYKGFIDRNPDIGRFTDARPRFGRLGGLRNKTKAFLPNIRGWKGLVTDVRSDPTMEGEVLRSYIESFVKGTPDEVLFENTLVLSDGSTITVKMPHVPRRRTGAGDGRPIYESRVPLRKRVARTYMKGQLYLDISNQIPTTQLHHQENDPTLRDDPSTALWRRYIADRSSFCAHEGVTKLGMLAGAFRPIDQLLANDTPPTISCTGLAARRFRRARGLTRRQHFDLLMDPVASFHHHVIDLGLRPSLFRVDGAYVQRLDDGLLDELRRRIHADTGIWFTIRVERI